MRIAFQYKVIYISLLLCKRETKSFFPKKVNQMLLFPICMGYKQPTFFLCYAGQTWMYQSPPWAPSHTETSTHEASRVHRQLLFVVHQWLLHMRDLVLNSEANNFMWDISGSHTTGKKLVFQQWRMERCRWRAAKGGIPKRCLKQACRWMW